MSVPSDGSGPDDSAPAVLANPHSGPHRDGAERVREALERAGMPHRVRDMDPREIPAEVARLAEEGRSVIPVAGGDGTLRAAAQELLGRESALAPLPGGTLNHFCRRLGVGEMDDAVAVLDSGVRRDVAVGLVDDRAFLNTATFGFYADAVRRRERWRGRIGKRPAAVAAVTTLLARMPSMEIEIHLDDRVLRHTTPLVWVGVGRGSFPAVQEAGVEDPRPHLEVAILEPGGRWGMLRLLARIGFAQLRENPLTDHPLLEVVHTRRFLLRARHHVGATLDGEVFRLQAPLECAIADGALTILSPA